MRNKKRVVSNSILIIGTVVIVLALINFVKADSTVWTLSSSTVSINLTFNETPLVNKIVNLTTQLLSIINATNTTANITLPYGVELIGGSTQWNGSLIENITRNLTITIRVNSTGNFSIEANARDPPNGSTYMGAREFIYLEVTDSNTKVSNVPIIDSSWNYTHLAINTSLDPANVTINSTLPNETAVNLSFLRPLIDSPFNETNFTNGSTSITVKGRFLFKNRNGNNVGARFVTVYLFDADTLTLDDFLESALTDVNGRFTIGPVSNNDGEFGTQDIYVRFIARSSVGTVQDFNNNWYDAFTPRERFPNVPDGTKDIGTWVVNSTTKLPAVEPFWIYDDILSGWLYVVNTASPSLTPVQAIVEWNRTSTHGTHYHPDGSNEIHLLAGHANDRDVVLHEYGHHVMREAYGQTMPPNDCPLRHFINRISAPNCAWSEGWANYVPLFTDNDHIFRDTTQNFVVNFETRTPSEPWDNGDQVEGNIAASLWDFSDDSSEDAYSGNFNNHVWNTFERQNDNDFSQYWTAWQDDHTAAEENNALIALAQNTIYYSTTEISCANGIDEDGDGYTDCADGDCKQGNTSQNGFCCGSGCSINGGTCVDASKSGFTCTDGNCNTYSEACRNGELESSLVCSGTSLSCSGGSCEYGFGAPQWCDEITPSDTACENSPGIYDELACEVSGTDCYYESELSCNAPSGCDEKLQDICSINIGFQCEWQSTYVDNAVEECESTTCGAISQCDEQLTGYEYSSCTTGGQNYFADKCSSSCQGTDRGDNTCRSSAFATGCTAASNCNGLSTGADLNTCNQVGQTYYEEECSSSCGYQDVTSVFECTETGCSCTTSQCDGVAPQGTINYCNKGGQTYFQDDCGSTAAAEDANSICRSANSLQSGDGCTADSQCNGITAGTGNCDVSCNFVSDPNKLSIKSSAGETTAWLSDSGNIFLKGNLEVYSNYQKTSNDELIMNFKGKDVLIIDKENGSMYLKGNILENQNTFNIKDNSDEWIIKDTNGNVVLYVNESGYVFMKGSVNASKITGFKNAFFVKDNIGNRVARFDDVGNVVLKGTLEQNSNYQRTANDEWVIRNNENDVFILDKINGSLYIDGTLFQNQTALNPKEGSDDFIIKNEFGITTAFVNESGSMFLRGALTQNGNP